MAKKSNEYKGRHAAATAWLWISAVSAITMAGTFVFYVVVNPSMTNAGEMVYRLCLTPAADYTCLTVAKRAFAWLFSGQGVATIISTWTYLRVGKAKVVGMEVKSR